MRPSGLFEGQHRIHLYAYGSAGNQVDRLPQRVSRQIWAVRAQGSETEAGDGAASEEQLDAILADTRISARNTRTVDPIESVISAHMVHRAAQPHPPNRIRSDNPNPKPITPGRGPA